MESLPNRKSLRFPISCLHPRRLVDMINLRTWMAPDFTVKVQHSHESTWNKNDIPEPAEMIRSKSSNSTVSSRVGHASRVTQDSATRELRPKSALTSPNPASSSTALPLLACNLFYLNVLKIGPLTFIHRTLNNLDLHFSGKKNAYCWLLSPIQLWLRVTLG